MKQHMKTNSDQNVYFPNSLGQPQMQLERGSNRKDQGLVTLVVSRNLDQREPGRTTRVWQSQFLWAVGKLGINQLQQVTNGF